MASIIEQDHFRGRAVASHGSGGDGGGTVDDIQKRLATVETTAGEARSDIREIKVILPTLATKTDLAEFRGEVKTELAEFRSEAKTELAEFRSEVKIEFAELRGDIRLILAILPTFATKTELAEVRGEVREIKTVLPHFATKAELETLARKQIQWFVGTAVALTAIAFSAAKFVH